MNFVVQFNTDHVIAYFSRHFWVLASRNLLNKTQYDMVNGVYMMSFMGLKFVSRLLWTLKPKTNLKN